jgi:flagellar motor switch protein FliN/FliY
MATDEANRLDVVIELGRARIKQSQSDDLRAGALVELDQTVNEPVSLFANDVLMARGEIVVIDNRFCVRVTELVAHVNALA